jgi:hypothetical protein
MIDFKHMRFASNRDASAPSSNPMVTLLDPIPICAAFVQSTAFLATSHLQRRDGTTQPLAASNAQYRGHSLRAVPSRLRLAPIYAIK